jgi:hypothetical protein
MYLGSQNVNTSGIANFTTLPLLDGSHDFKAVYNGDDTFLASTSNVVSPSIGGTSNNATMIVDDGLYGQYSLMYLAGGHSLAPLAVN